MMEVLPKFDYIVSNRHLNLIFSDYRDDLDSKKTTSVFCWYFPNILKKEKDKMAIYLLFIQHIMPLSY